MEDEDAHIMKDSNYVEYSQLGEEEEEEEEEALSLCDLPLNENSIDDKSYRRINRPSSLPDASELFNGFSSSSSSDMCPADDIIFCGRLVPFFKDREEDHDHDNIQPLKNLNAEVNNKNKPPPTRRRRSESVSCVTRSNSVSTYGGSRRLIMRNSRSLNYSRLRESSSSSSSAPEVDRNSSSRSVASSEAAAKKPVKPRWYSILFGTMKVPPEMELSDMKNRQVRRNSSTSMFPGTDSCRKVAVNRSSGKVSWGILKALSCKDHNSVAVTTSFALPQAS